MHDHKLCPKYNRDKKSDKKNAKSTDPANSNVTVGDNAIRLTKYTVEEEKHEEEQLEGQED